MTGPEFWFTRAGMRLAEATMPKIADQLQLLNDNLAALVAELRLQREPRVSKETAPQPPSQR